MPWKSFASCFRLALSAWHVYVRCQTFDFSGHPASSKKPTMDVHVSMSLYLHALPAVSIFSFHPIPQLMYYLFFVFQNVKIIAIHSQNFIISDKFHCIDPITLSNNQIDKLIHSYAVGPMRTTTFLQTTRSQFC